jgi:HAD superfamily hydrolase (TIGR01490 family)
MTMTQAAFFDLDKTVIARSSTLAFGPHLYRAGFFGKRTLLKMALGQIFYVLLGADEDQLERARDELLTLVSGRRKIEVERIVEETLHDVAEPLVYAEALSLIDEHTRQGRRVFIVSASPEEIVRPFARYLGVNEVIATRIQTNDMGRYVPEIEVYAMGPGKAEAMREVAEREGIDLEASYAYSDSITDLPMMEVVGHPVAVNPERELRKVAEEREWPILVFKRPVTLGPTIPRPSPVASAVVAGVGAAVVVALLLRKNLRR